MTDQDSLFNSLYILRYDGICHKGAGYERELNELGYGLGAPNMTDTTTATTGMAAKVLEDATTLLREMPAGEYVVLEHGAWRWLLLVSEGEPQDGSLDPAEAWTLPPSTIVSSGPVDGGEEGRGQGQRQGVGSVDESLGVPAARLLAHGV